VSNQRLSDKGVERPSRVICDPISCPLPADIWNLGCHHRPSGLWGRLGGGVNVHCRNQHDNDSKHHNNRANQHNDDSVRYDRRCRLLRSRVDRLQRALGDPDAGPESFYYQCGPEGMVVIECGPDGPVDVTDAPWLR